MQNIKRDFPILNHDFNGKQLIYLDNASTTQKPQKVISSISDFYSKYNANVHRSVYQLGEHATLLFEDSRKKIAHFINAAPNEIVFNGGTTDGINFVALAWAKSNISRGDEIIISQMEHHSNIVPWQQLAMSNNAILKIIPVNENGTLDLFAYEALLSNKTKLVSIVHVSNVLGTHNDVELITKKAHNFGAKVLVDVAQSIAHQKIDVKKIHCDFLVFSGHKLLGPTGVGVIYIEKSLHDQIEPYQFGGGMIFSVDIERSTWLKAPEKFEAGTPPIAEVIGLGSAIDYINENINFDELRKHEAILCSRLIDGLSNLSNVRILGPTEQLKRRGHIVSFILNGVHPHDVAAYLDSFGICVRAGHHCAQPLHKALGIESSVRVSFYGYNSLQEVDYLIEKIYKISSDNLQ